MRVSPPYFLMKYLPVLLGGLIIIFLPKILVPIAFNLYKEKFYEDVVSALEENVKNEPYCIIAPRITRKNDEGVGYPYREWVVLRDPLMIDLRHVLDHAVREKLIFYAKEGRSIKERAESGREMHFGIALKDTFYIWSLKKRAFVELRLPTPIRYLQELKNKHSALSQDQNIKGIPRRINLIDYYCPLLYQ